ncbi:MAG: HipA domain-containing protein, partial [Cyclobacteriaceae bacterium]|nr:HipA domain-containing protein [Cyclobacteriaceae bacterium]
MNKCPITYLPCGDSRYSEKGLRLLASGLSRLKRLQYTAEEQRKEAFNRSSKMSVQGVQPKLSAVLNIKEERFDIVDKSGRFLLKPQHYLYPQMPENEDLTMRLAASIGLDVPVHGMIWAKDNTLTYFIKRFDRKGQKDKIPVEDFAQLAGLSRDTKYNYSMESLVRLVNAHCTFPAVEKVKLFKLVVFSFITGNEDMHLKNFSIINQNGKIEISPCYDLLNTTIEIKNATEEIALSLKGKKKNLTKSMLINYFGGERCDLNDKVITSTVQTIFDALPGWIEYINNSFLSDEMKEKYIDVVESRFERL